MSGREVQETSPALTRRGLRRNLLPGILVAATGVGAGDLATASLAGSRLGVAVLWAVVAGAFLKFVLTEGLARWQLATGKTLLEGCAERARWPFAIAFFLYLFPWSFFVGTAMMSACGVTMYAMLPVFSDASTGKVVFGIAHSLIGLVLVRLGGYRLFGKIMSVCIAVMFVTVVAAAALQPVSWSSVAHGLVVPTIPAPDHGGLSWTIALMGGVGGTLTVLCYGYWIREEGRGGKGDLALCRLDLSVGYVMTALFGIGMVIIGSQVEVEGKGAGLIVSLAGQLGSTIGPFARWAFLLGAYGAVFSSLLGVWQSVPYIFADVLAMTLRDSESRRAARVSEHSRTYRLYLYLIAAIPVIGLFYGFSDMQKLYAVVGACFMPLLALVLLILNGHHRWVGRDLKNRPLTSALLVATLIFFAIAGWYGAD